MRQAFWRMGIAVLAVVLPGAAHAQSSITGQVTDNTGGILPGVTVEASSPVLIEGSRFAITDGAGRYTIIDLQPGEYVVTFTLVGFSTQIRDGLTLPGDFTLTVDATMAVGALEETVTVSGQAPVVDVQRVARVETLTRETQEAIPTGGSLWNYAALVPGVKPIRPDVGGSRAMQQSWMFGRGASSRQTTLEVDGMTLNTFLDDGRVKPYNNPQMTQEMSVSTNAMNAETGHGGVRINIIPREGGNSFSGSLFGSTTPGALSQDNFNERLRRVGVKEGTTPKLESTYDAQFGFGGPIRQDRIWFFTAGRQWSTNQEVLNATNRDGSTAVDDNRIRSALARITTQVTDTNKWTAYIDKAHRNRFHEFSALEDRDTASTNVDTINYYNANTKWTSTISTRMLLETGFSFVGQADRFANQDGIVVDRPDNVFTCIESPCHPDMMTPEQAAMQGLNGAAVHPWYGAGPDGGGLRRVDGRLGGYSYSSRGLDQTSLPYASSFLASLSYVTGSHNFRMGFTNDWGHITEGQSGNADIALVNYSSGLSPFDHHVSWMDAGHAYARCDAAGLNCGRLGAPESVLVSNSPNLNTRAVKYSTALYAQDSWTIDRLTINAGLRMEIAKPSSPAVGKPAGRFTTAALFPAAPDCAPVSGDPRQLVAMGQLDLCMPTMGPDIAPRFSAVWDIFGSGRTALKFGWNRYYHAFGITGVFRLQNYAGAAARTDERDWFDVTLMPGTNTPMGAPGCERIGTCANPYGTDGDNIVQDWEIGTTADASFATGVGGGSARKPHPDLQRKFDDLISVTLQHEVAPGVSLMAEYRRRSTKENTVRTFVNRTFDFERLPDGSVRFIDNQNWVKEINFLAPAPYTGIIPIYGIHPASERRTEQLDETVFGHLPDVFGNFELGISARLANGGTVFGGWTAETPGRGEAGGIENYCGIILQQSRGDYFTADPNSYRFCDEYTTPRNWRNEFKLSGSLPLAWGLRLAGTYQAYPATGNAIGTGMVGEESFRVDSRGTDTNNLNYVAPFYTAENCIAPCRLNAAIAPSLRSGQLGYSSFYDVELMPQDTVKYLPHWTTLDLSIARTFITGGWSWEARLDAFNALNNGIELRHRSSSRGRRLNDATFEQAQEVLVGRVLRVTFAARF